MFTSFHMNQLRPVMTGFLQFLSVSVRFFGNFLLW
jgi:hypothetical protein